MSKSIARPDRLLVPLDGSAASDRVIPAVVNLASKLSIRVRVLHVFRDIKQMSRMTEGDVDWTADAEPRAFINAPAAIRESCARLNESGIEFEVIGRVGSAANEIVREAEFDPTAWIMMSSQGAGGIRRLFMGSTTTAVVRAAEQPVIMIPSELTDQRVNDLLHRPLISVFLDGSANAETAIQPAAMLAGDLKTQLDVVRVAETMRDSDDRPTPDDDRWEAPEVERVREYLERQGSACADTYGIEVVPVILAGSPAVQLMRYAERARPGLVALATRKRSGIERWTYGSLAEQLVDRMQTPLLLIPVEPVS
ncbi:MAG: universal stress protein [Sphaerobacteraceae bacterium]|nr:MAG: universal stress protein [Sphaerobacteraceae bacterium]